MKRFYFTRTARPNPVLGRSLVSSVIQGEDLASAQASMDGVFRSRGLPDTHQLFEWQDLDEVREPLGGLLAVTMVDQ